MSEHERRDDAPPVDPEDERLEMNPDPDVDDIEDGAADARTADPRVAEPPA